MSKGNLRVKAQAAYCMFAVMRDALWLVERLITWSMQEHCRCLAYLIRVLTAGQKKEDLENVPKISLYVSRCYYPWKRTVAYPEWLLLLVISIPRMGHQLLRNVHVLYLIQQLTCQVWKCSSWCSVLAGWMTKSDLFANCHCSSGSEWVVGEGLKTS